LHRLSGVGELQHQAVAQALAKTAPAGGQDFARIPHEVAPTLDESAFVTFHQADRLDNIQHHHHLGEAVDLVQGVGSHGMCAARAALALSVSAAPRK